MLKFHLKKSVTIVSMLLLAAAANAVDSVSPRVTSTVPRLQSVTPADLGQTVQMPGVSRAIMPPVTSDESERAINARKLPVGLNHGVAVTTKTNPTPRIASTLRTSGDTSPAAPASIPELARALRNNPDLIYEYVRNNIEYVPIWGVQKGPMGTLLDNQGTAFDQASLMVVLLREAGLTASFVKGRVNLSAAQITEWLGIDANNACGVIRLLGAGQIPTTSIDVVASSDCSGGAPVALRSLKVDHVWVKANIGGTNYYLNP